MTDKEFQYYLGKDRLIDIRIDHYLMYNIMHVSIYNDRNDTSVAYDCTREDLKGLADFLYDTIGEKK